MRQHHFFTSDLSVNEFLLVKEVGFQPLGLVMGSSIFHVGFHPVRGISEELTTLTQALYHARELAMVRMEEEADALGADGIVAVRLTLTIHQWGSNVIEFLAIGTAVKNAAGEGTWRASNGKPFQSDLSGQDFWTLLHAGYRPVGMVMGNCVYFVAPQMHGNYHQNMELTGPTQAFYDARELAMERMQAEAEALGAEGIVGVTVDESNHTWGVNVLEFSAIGTAVVANRGIPLRAQERLAEEAGPNRKLFTSDLSVSEFLLARDVKCEPISQVMGSSIYHIGQIADYKGKTGEITIISDAHSEARRRAVSRLFQEAAFVRADAVIGARLRERMITMGSRGKGGDDGGEVIEFTVVGTAVRAPWITHPPGQPIITDLSGQELWALAQDGYEPTCFLFEFCRYHVWHVTADSTRSGEVTAATDAIDQARNIASMKLQRQARAFGAEFVVGSDIKLEAREVPCGYAECERNDLDVDLSWFCTGIRRIPGARRRTHVEIPPLTLTMTKLGRRQNDIIDGGDDADEIERAAEDAQKAALEAEEGR